MQNSNQSTTTFQSVDSTTPLQGSSSQKDYQNAFGSLQSSFGFGTTAPTTIPRTLPSSSKKTSWFKSKPTPKQTQPDNTVPSSSTSPSSSSAPHVPSNEKDYEAAFGALSSNFGFGPSPSGPSSVGRGSGGKRK